MSSNVYYLIVCLQEPSSPSSSSQQSSVIGSISKNKGRKGYYDDTKGLLSSEDESLPLDNKTVSLNRREREREIER